MERNIVSPEIIREYLVAKFVTFEHIRRAIDSARDEVLHLIDEGCIPGPSYIFDHEEFFAPSVISWILQAQALEPSPDRANKIYQKFETNYFESLIRRSAREHGFSHLFKGADLDSERAKASAAETWRHFLNGTFGICIRKAITADSIVQKGIAVHKVAVLTDNGSALSIAFEKRGTLIAALEEFDQIVSQFAPHDWANSSRKRLFDDLIPRYGLQGKFPHFRG